MSTDVWINVKNTYLVRNLKNPNPQESNKWASRKHILEVLAGFSGDGKKLIKDGFGIKVSLEQLSRLTGHTVSFISRTIPWWINLGYLKRENRVKIGSRANHEFSLNLNLICINQQDDISCGTIVPRTNVKTPPTLSTFVPRTNDICSTDKRHLFLGQIEQIDNVLNNECMYECEKPSIHYLDKEQTKEEPEMSELDNSLYEKLIERGLNKKQAQEIFAIEQTKGGYTQTNLSYFDNQFKNSPEKNNAGMLLTCLRNNWGGWGKSPKPLKIASDSPEGLEPDNPSPIHYPARPKLTLTEFEAMWNASSPKERQHFMEKVYPVCSAIEYRRMEVDLVRPEFASNYLFRMIHEEVVRNPYLGQNLKDLGLSEVIH